MGVGISMLARFLKRLGWRREEDQCNSAANNQQAARPIRQRQRLIEQEESVGGGNDYREAVSYTHLTLPTILLV